MPCIFTQTNGFDCRGSTIYTLSRAASHNTLKRKARNIGMDPCLYSTIDSRSAPQRTDRSSPHRRRRSQRLSPANCAGRRRLCCHITIAQTSYATTCSLPAGAAGGTTLKSPVWCEFVATACGCVHNCMGNGQGEVQYVLLLDVHESSPSDAPSRRWHLGGADTRRGGVL